MNKYYLQSKLKSTGTTYLFWFFFGAHYAYLGRWGLQFLFWFTFGGLGIWAFVDLFAIPGKVDRHNATIFQKIDDVERSEREQEHARNMAMIQATKV